MKERIPNFSQEENVNQKTVDSIIELLKGKSYLEIEAILRMVGRTVDEKSILQ